MIINKLLVKLGLGDGSLNVEVDQRRKHIRYAGQEADVTVEGQTHSLQDWSFGGFSFDAPPNTSLAAGDTVSFTLHFRFPHDTITVEQRARVVRAGKRGVAAQFLSDDTLARRALDRVFDSYQAQGFLQSQVA